MSRSWAGGSTRYWREVVRPLVLARDGYVCRIAIPGVCTTAATCVHHTLGKARTGDDPDYCVAACQPCNLAVGDPTDVPDPEPRVTTQW
jgi:hypothetical protein